MRKIKYDKQSHFKKKKKKKKKREILNHSQINCSREVKLESTSSWLG